MGHPATETLESYFAERLDVLRVMVVKGSNGGDEIVLRLDGTYFTDEADVESQARYTASRLNRALRASLGARGRANAQHIVGTPGWITRQIRAFRDLAGDWSDHAASELLESGACTANCLLAYRDDDCDCKCAGQWHGALAEARVDL